MTTAILLVGHGTRRPAERLARNLREAPQMEFAFSWFAFVRMRRTWRPQGSWRIFCAMGVRDLGTGASSGYPTGISPTTS